MAMRWCRVFHAEINQEATIPESSLDVHRARGWIRVGQLVELQDQAVAEPGPYVDLDAPPAEPPASEPAPEPPVKTTRKEK